MSITITTSISKMAATNPAIMKMIHCGIGWGAGEEGSGGEGRGGEEREGEGRVRERGQRTRGYRVI